MPEREGPKLVFVHLISPHPPFVFDQYGNDVDWTNYLNWREKQYYLGQYIFISNQIEEVVTKIQSDSKRPTIIIIQSDHGPRGMWGFDKYLDIPATEQAKIFNAYYLPSQDYSGFTNETSPINSFRLVFNQVFNTNFELIDTS
jgi:phosphoglycerol transferase MdoB-like AlkP superfamily enzyme